MDKYFLKYACVGVLNTAIHWGVFLVMFAVFHIDQAISNLVAFCISVSFSFFLNSSFTFKADATTKRYILYVGFMGFLSLIVGYVADRCALPPLFTLVFFSAISLVCGFLYSKYFVFKGSK